jgi:hypothetical protein
MRQIINKNLMYYFNGQHIFVRRSHRGHFFHSEIHRNEIH